MHTAVKKQSNVLKGKDLITIGIFSAIYFIINFIFMLMGGLHPVMWILMPGFIALFSGIPYLMMCTKVQKPGAVIIMGMIVGLFYFVTGQFTLLILLTMAAACVLAEAARWITKHNTFKGNALSFVFFSLGMTGSPLPIWVMREGFLTQISAQGMPADYIASLKALMSPVMLAVLFAAPVIGGIIGSLFAGKIFKKHFAKAGII